MHDPLPRRRELPPFEKTLAGHASSTPAVGLDATFGREAFSATLAMPAPSASSVLPEVSIDLDGRVAREMDARAPDLRIVGTLGEGGMGVVHLAEQRSLERRVAVKVPRAGAPEHADAALCDEAVVTGRLEHPNIVPVHAFGRTSDGRPVMVMKRVEGVPWRTLLDEPDHVLWKSIGTGDRLLDHLEILISLSNALAFAHSRSVVHRDVKPENVLVGAFGEVVLVDFGLAVRLDQPQPPAQGIVGTPVYMAPEMVAGWEIDARTDVYLLGATLHEILAGRPPHDGESLMTVLSHAYASPQPIFDASIPDELASVCSRALSRHPDDRFQDVRSFRLALQEFLTHRASLALARRGEARLGEARSLKLPIERRAALTEARFACRQAIEQWPDNTIAIATERKTTLEAIALELEEHNPAGARALLHALEPKPEELVVRIEALERSLGEDRRKAERLAQIEHDMDATVGAESRLVALVVFAVAATLMSVYVTGRIDRGQLSTRDTVPVALVMFLFVSVVLAAMWRSLAGNAYGRKLALVGWSTTAAMVVHRTLASLGGETVANVLAGDSLLFTAMLVVAGVLLDPRLLFGVPVTLGGALVSTLSPAHAPLAFTSSTILLIVAGAVFVASMRGGRRA